MAKKMGKVPVIDKRYSANPGSSTKTKGNGSSWFRDNEGGSERPNPYKPCGAESFGLAGGKVRRRYRRREDGSWERLLDIPRREEEELEAAEDRNAGKWKGGPILPPAKAGKRGLGSKGSAPPKKRVADQRDETWDAEKAFSRGHNGDGKGEKKGRRLIVLPGVDPDEIDDEYIENLPCMKDERESGFGTTSDELEGRRWIRKE